MKQAMLKSLRDLQSYCELIIYTYLPRAFLDKLIEAHLPEFVNIFSYTLCREEMVEVGEYRIKDMS